LAQTQSAVKPFASIRAVAKYSHAKVKLVLFAILVRVAPLAQTQSAV